VLFRSVSSELTPFLSGNLETLMAQETKLELSQLVRFYQHPVKMFFKQRWGATLDVYAQEIDDEEPFLLSALDKYQMVEQGVEHGINDGDSPDFVPC